MDWTARTVPVEDDPTIPQPHQTLVDPYYTADGRIRYKCPLCVGVAFSRTRDKFNEVRDHGSYEHQAAFVKKKIITTAKPLSMKPRAVQYRAKQALKRQKKLVEHSRQQHDNLNDHGSCRNESDDTGSCLELQHIKNEMQVSLH